MHRKLVMAVPIAAAVLVGTTGCASKGFVRTSVGEVNEKVDSVGRAVEETQERTRQNEGRIADVDKRATAGIASATEAASAAQNTANQATSAAKEAATSASTANQKADALDKAARRLVFEVVLSEDQGNFKFAQTALPDEAKSALDQMIQRVKADPRGAFFEIEGHTDSTGANMTNERLGLERAEAVKRYLYEQHQIPLHKMNVISYGEEKPIAPNNTRDGRAQNRRVVIKVLA
jgi:outer membrane protein OmpA-like peptidoglycan-associated protein